MHKKLNEALKALKAIVEDIEDVDERIAALNLIKRELSALSPLAHHPVDCVVWLPYRDVKPNDYNPNKVAPQEMALLAHSVMSDGYTQPVVAVEDDGAYTIVDGYHRYSLIYRDGEVRASTLGYMPTALLASKGRAALMAATVRHNRARGAHGIERMSALVRDMMASGLKPDEVCLELGMESDELRRLIVVTGLARLFEDYEYSKAFTNGVQIAARQAYAKDNDDGFSYT